MTATAPSTPTRRTPRGWPFFAPSQDVAITAALDLAEVGPGVRLVDLGCGEGDVLVAGARRGAVVRGVECDHELVTTARAELAQAGLAGEVVAGDLFDPSTYHLGANGQHPTVFFSYLSPAMLQRLTPILRTMSGRLVTVDFDLPNVVPHATSGAARLYRLPDLQWADPQPDDLGWTSAGTMCIMPPQVNSLTCLEIVHPGGPVTVSLRGSLARHVSVATGADVAQAGQTVAIDLRWRERVPGTLAQGVVEVAGAHRHPVTVLFAHGDQGQWDLSPDGCADLDARLRRRSLPRPTTTQELLEALGL